MNQPSPKTESQEAQQGLTQRAILLMAANIVATVMSFALPMALVRAMSQSEYGLYKQAFQIVLTALGLLNLQVAVSVYYYVAREPGKKLQVVLNIIAFYFGVGLMVMVVFLLWPGWVTLVFHTSDLVPHIPLLGVAILCVLVSTNLEAVPIALEDVRLASALIVAFQLTKAALMIVAALVFGSLTAILMAAVIQGLLQIAFTVFYLRRRFGRILAPMDWPLFKAQIGNALPFGVGGIAATVQTDLHNYFVSYYCDPATFAIYSVAGFQLPLMGMMVASFASALNPELARHKEANDYQAVIHVWTGVIRKLTYVLAPACALMLVLRREIITVLFTPAYGAAAPIFAVNLLIVMLGVAVHSHMLRLFEELRYFRLKLYLFLTPLTWGVLYLGFRRSGLVGVAMAVLCVQTFDIAITLLMVQRELGMARGDLRRLPPILKIACAALAAAAPAFAIKVMLHQTPAFLQLVIVSFCFGVFYLIAIFATGCITQSERAQLREMWRRYSPRTAAFFRLSPEQIGSGE